MSEWNECKIIFNSDLINTVFNDEEINIIKSISAKEESPKYDKYIEFCYNFVKKLGGHGDDCRLIIIDGIRILIDNIYISFHRKYGSPDEIIDGFNNKFKIPFACYVYFEPICGHHADVLIYDNGIKILNFSVFEEAHCTRDKQIWSYDEDEDFSYRLF